jgi:hypothetical protein
MLYTIDISEDEIVFLEKFLGKLRPNFVDTKPKVKEKKLTKTEQTTKNWREYKANKKRKL